MTQTEVANMEQELKIFEDTMHQFAKNEIAHVQMHLIGIMK